MEIVIPLMDKQQYWYETCGISIQSDTPFSIAQSPFRGTSDIRFTLKTTAGSTEGTYVERAFLGQIKNGAGHPSIAVYRIEKGYILDCHNTARRVEFVIARDASWIDCYAHVGAGQGDIEVWLFGLVMSFILQNRGIFTLHASAIDCGGQAIAFLGSNGYGKSTLAFFFANHGHALITDDVLPIVEKHNMLLARPGFPSVNLWRRTMDQIGSARQLLSVTDTGGGKHRYAIDDLKLARCASEIPLQRIYFLQPMNPDDAEAIRIDTVPSAQAMIDLLAYTRANSMIHLSAQKNLLRIYSRLLSQASIRRLSYPIGFEHLPRIYQAIMGDSLNERTTLKQNTPIARASH